MSGKYHHSWSGLYTNSEPLVIIFDSSTSANGSSGIRSTKYSWFGRPSSSRRLRKSHSASGQSWGGGLNTRQKLVATARR